MIFGFQSRSIETNNEAKAANDETHGERKYGKALIETEELKKVFKEKIAVQRANL